MGVTLSGRALRYKSSHPRLGAVAVGFPLQSLTHIPECQFSVAVSVISKTFATLQLRNSLKKTNQ